ncbi:MAG: energy-coupling factor transporter transmembrane protein EcfT [Ktedonobacteraceae bacterium]|nr:energy-coupling factor transporter transmembrane protein EcfT [Ktedonobacteraceae bacterium]
MLINFPYIQRDTPVHRLDPRAKFILLFAYSIAAAQTSNFWIILAGLVGAVFYYSQAHLKWRETRKVWYLIIAVNVLIILMNYFFSGGQVVQGVDLPRQHVFSYLPFIGFQRQPPYIGPISLPISVEIILFMITQSMRNFSIAFLAVAIPYTTNPGHIGIAFKGMGLPDRFSYAIDLAIRFLPTIGRDFSVTLDAQRARGYEIDKLRGGVFGKIARLAPLVVPVVIGSIVGAEDIINAMELRCFGLGKRSWLTELHARRVDRAIIIFSLAFLIIITLWNIAGNYSTDSLLHFLHIQGIPDFLLP